MPHALLVRLRAQALSRALPLTWPLPLTLLLALLLTLSGCADRAALPLEAGIGPAPQLPAPPWTLVPTVDIAPAVGWPAGKVPLAAPGLVVTALARDLDHPRWLHVLPNGDILVAETNAPPRPADFTGIKGFIMKRVLKRAGALGQSANRITLLRDADGDGIIEQRTTFLENLYSPFGMAHIGQTLYVANTDAVVSFPYQTGATSISAAPRTVAPLPAGPLNHHWTKSLIASADGSRLYATVGSNSNAGENGIDKEQGRAAILEIDPASGATRVFASGLRNPNGMGWQPDSGVLWTVVNERDALGGDLVPDYLTSVADGAFYGWPYSYFGQHIDPRVEPARPDLVASAVVPDYALGNHVAAFGLAFYQGTLFPAQYAGGAFIGEHGSWNRIPKSGYKVVFVPFAFGKPSGMPIDVLSGFVSPAGTAYGRPVGVAVDKAGALLVADDVGNVVWRVAPAGR